MGLTERNALALARLQPRPSTIPEHLRGRVARLATAAETRRERVRAELASLRPRRDALHVAGFSVAAPSDEAYEDCVRHAFRDRLTQDLDELLADLHERIKLVEEQRKGVEALYDRLEARLAEHTAWHLARSETDVEGVARRNPRSQPADVALDSEARFRAARSGRTVGEEFVRAMLDARIGGEEGSSPKDAFQMYEDLFDDLQDSVYAMLPETERRFDVIDDVDAVDSVTVSTRRFLTALQRARTAGIAHTPDARLDAGYKDGTVRLPVGRVFDPFAESAAVVDLTWTREGESLAESFEVIGGLAKNYRAADEAFERSRLLNRLVEEGARARELRALADDAQQLANDAETAHNNVWSPEARDELQAKANLALVNYDDHGLYILDPLRRKIECDPHTLDVPHEVLDAFAAGREPPSSKNSSAFGSAAYLRRYAQRAQRVRAVAEDIQAAMARVKQVQVYPSLVVRMLTHMTAIAAATFYILGASRPPEGMALELVYRFAQSPLMQELNVLGVAAEALYVQKAGEWAFMHARAGFPRPEQWARMQMVGSRLVQAVDQSENAQAIVHLNRAAESHCSARGVSVVADAMLGRARRSAARRLSLAQQRGARG